MTTKQFHREMESALEFVNIQNDNVQLACCIEYSIDTNDIVYCVLQSLIECVFCIVLDTK